jgi:flavin-dependent dehydrogenase
MSVVILGGGPAGVAAALTLLDTQIPVTIVDRELFPRSRPGETLHPGIEPLLLKLGLAAELHAGDYLRHDGIWSTWGGPTRFVPYGKDDNQPWRGFQAVRSDFDYRILKHACSRGAELINAEIVGVISKASGAVRGVMTSNGPCHASHVIDCSGGSHYLARKLQIPIVPYSPRLIARYGYVRGMFNGLAPSICSDSGGWTWIAEIESNRFQWTRVTEAHNSPKPDWVPGNLRGLKAESSRGADVTWRMAERVSGPGWYLAGDSAAVLDPSSSHGVLRAMMSGMMAAHLVACSLSSRAASWVCAQAYQDWLTAWFHHDRQAMSYAYREASLFGVESYDK